MYHDLCVLVVYAELDFGLGNIPHKADAAAHQ